MPAMRNPVVCVLFSSLLAGFAQRQLLENGFSVAAANTRLGGPTSKAGA